MLRSFLRPLRRSALGEALARSPLRRHNWSASLRAARNLWFKYGHLRSVQTRSAVDPSGRPVPWYTYPAIEYLSQFDFSNRSVFEFGSGNSTLFWSSRAKQVVSVEDDDKWFAQMRGRVPANCTLIFEPDLKLYPTVIDRFDERYDVIIVDGPARGRTRFRCAQRSLSRLKPAGLIILDNSDWLPESARLLRESGLLQVDMSGFVPIAAQTQTTSLFFDRSCQLQPLAAEQPQPSWAAQRMNWEAPPPASAVGRSVEWEGLTITAVLHSAHFTKQTPTDQRGFTVAFRQKAIGKVDSYIYDETLGRIVDGATPLPRGSTIERESQRLEKMSWDDFCEYIRRSPMRRYLLKELPRELLGSSRSDEDRHE